MKQKDWNIMVTDEELHTAVVEELSAIAPEVDSTALRDDQPLRDQVDLDSMDWLNFLIALHRRFAVEIPEADAGRLHTVDDVTTYVRSRLSTT